MDLALLDTDMLSELLKQRNPQVVANAAEYLREHRQFAFSVFTNRLIPIESHLEECRIVNKPYEHAVHR